jgi:GDP-4-dehydro-6-deoxy-D-mannose reductase
VRLLVTGIAGFGGRHLLRWNAASAGHELHGADHFALESVPEPDELRKGLASYRALDITDPAAMSVWVREGRPDAVLHMAAQSSGADSIERPAETYRVNALGALHLLEAVRTLGAPAAVLVIGSADIYGSGDPGSRLREDAPIRPANPYAVSKAAQDALGELYAKTYGLRVVRTRTFAHTGPGQRPQFALAGFADQLARIDAGLLPPEIRVGNLDVVREYGDVRDVVRAYALLLEKGQAGEAYNVCTGREFTLRELLDRLLSLSGVRASVTTDPTRLRSRDVSRLVGDPAKLETATGWRPTYSTEQTLTDLYQDARDRVRRESGR